MKNDIKVLIVDDHPMIIEGYRNTLFRMKGLSFKISTAENTDEAINFLRFRHLDNNFDLILLDVKIPPSLDGKIISGEDLGLRIREISPQSKIIIITMHDETPRLNSILKNLKPEGFIIKTDLTPDILMKAVEVVLSGDFYHSTIIKNVLRRNFSNDIEIDDYDRKILFYLSKNIKTKDLTNHIFLSLPAIERRKRILREKLGAIEGDHELLQKARDFGFI